MADVTSLHLRSSTGDYYALAFGPDGCFLAGASSDETIHIWALEHQGEILNAHLHHALRGPADRFIALTFSPDSQTLAGSWDTVLCVWDVKSGELHWQYNGHTSKLRTVVFSSGGETLASASYDQTVRLWDLRSGKVCHTMSGHTNTITSTERADFIFLKARLLGAYGRARCDHGQLEQAGALFAEELKLTEELGYRYRTVLAQTGLAAVALAQNDLPGALAWVERILLALVGE